MNTNLQLIYVQHSFMHCSFLQYENDFPAEVEAVVDSEDEGKMKEATSSGELLSRVQELEDELKDSERVQMDLIEANTALQNKLKASREEEDRTRQENASLKKKLVSALTSQVSRMEGFRQQTNHQECFV